MLEFDLHMTHILCPVLCTESSVLDHRTELCRCWDCCLYRNIVKGNGDLCSWTLFFWSVFWSVSSFFWSITRTISIEAHPRLVFPQKRITLRDNPRDFETTYQTSSTPISFWSSPRWSSPSLLRWVASDYSSSGGRVEFHVTGIAESEHGKLKLLKWILWQILSKHESPKPNHITRWLSISGRWN